MTLQPLLRTEDRVEITVHPARGCRSPSGHLVTRLWFAGSLGLCPWAPGPLRVSRLLGLWATGPWAVAHCAGLFGAEALASQILCCFSSLFSGPGPHS